MNAHEIRLKPEDSPAPPDPQATIIEMTAMARAIAAEALQLRDLCTRWDSDPSAVFRRAMARSVDLHDQAARLEATVETLARGLRYARVFSVDVGVSDGR